MSLGADIEWLPDVSDVDETGCDCRRIGSFLMSLLCFFSPLLSTPWSTFLDFAMGSASPRNLPRLATPIPHVKVVL